VFCSVYHIQRNVFSLSFKNFKVFEKSIEIPSNINRQRIYLYIKSNPGVHLRKISKVLDIAIGDTNYNLNNLEQSGFVKHRKWGVYKRYFVISIKDGRSESILAILQQETPRTIVLYLIEHPGSIQNEICRHVSFSAPSVKWHMTRLKEMDMVYERKRGKFVRYYIKGNIADIVTLMKNYHPSIWSKFASKLAEVFIELSSGTNLNDSDSKEADYEG